MSDDISFDPKEIARKIELALERKRLGIKPKKGGKPTRIPYLAELRPPKVRKPPNPHKYICWLPSIGKWLVRVKINGKVLVHRRYVTQEEAIAVRDFTLTRGYPPPRRSPPGRHRGSNPVRRALQLMRKEGVDLIKLLQAQEAEEPTSS